MVNSFMGLLTLLIHAPTVLDGWHIDPMPIYAAFPSTRHVSKKLRIFIEWVSELMAPHTTSPALSRKRH